MASFFVHVLRPTFVLLSVALLMCGGRAATVPSSTTLDPKIEARVSSLLGQLTQEEKISLLSGTDYMHTQGIPRLKIPALKFSDGPVGVRCWGQSTAYPADALLAATWDRDAAREMGQAIGRDARARGVHIVLGPGTNIYREAQNGRNFEYVGEDPFLASAVVVDYIRGVQSQGVAACIKHFVANEEETQRGSIDMIVGRRALEEIYFPPFKAAIQEGNVWTAMAAYNKVNGEWCSASKFLLTDMLRDQWNFKGVLMSDWGATHDTLKDLNAGLDLEMNGSPREFYNLGAILPLLKSGQLTEATVDEHVRRLLRMIVSMGFMDRDQTDKSIPLDDPKNAAVAEKVASEGIVLLKNEHALLPLDRTRVHHLVVLGPNADPAVTGGGGSAGVTPFHKVSVLQAFQAVAGKGVQVDYVHEFSDALFPQSPFTPETAADGTLGLSADYFNNPDFQGAPVAHRLDRAIDFNWSADPPIPGIVGATPFSVRWKATIKPTESGDFVFQTLSDDGARVFIDGKKIVDSWKDQAPTPAESSAHLEKDHVYHLTVEYYNGKGTAEMHFGWGLRGFSEDEKRRISSADAVVYAGGLNPQVEHEGDDRAWEMPATQTQELALLIKMNPHLIVAINAGGNLGLGDNLDQIPALLWAWYPGQNGNTALAKIVMGDINPSGRLPDSFEKKFEDGPAFANYPGDPANGGSVHLDEGIYVGYRWFDKKKIAPAFPFGFGLSYSTFDFKKLNAVTTNKGIERSFTISGKVTNTGTRAGTEVVQLYVRPPQGSIDRSVQELKGFTRVSLKAGETKTFTMPLSQKDFQIFDEKTSTWITPPGVYQIAVGSSSRDIAQTTEITY